MPKTIVNTHDAPAAAGPYSQAVKAKGLVTEGYDGSESLLRIAASIANIAYDLHTEMERKKNRPMDTLKLPEEFYKPIKVREYREFNREEIYRDV